MLEILTPAVTHDLTVLDTVKDELGIAPSDTSKDARLRRLISEASSIVAEYCGRDGFGRTQYRETFGHSPWCSGVSRKIILTEDLNVTVDSVTVDGIVLDPAGYHCESGMLMRRIVGNASTILIGSYGWNSRLMEVVYWAGWDTLADVPRVVERAVLDLVSGLYSTPRSRDMNIRSEEVVGVGTITYGTQGSTSPLLAADRYPGLERYAKQVI